MTKGFMYSTDLVMGNVDHYESIQEEAAMYYTVNDAHDLIKEVGLKSFLEMLYQEKKGRVLTIEEIEAMQVLHDKWEL
jgi:hypothetical protein